MLDETQNNALNAAIESYQNTGAAVLPDDFNARIGDGDYVAIGTEFLRLLVEHSGLKPEAQVLDIGCGLGRVAQPLKHFLAPGGATLVWMWLLKMSLGANSTSATPPKALILST